MAAAQIAVRPSEIHGRGVFAVEDISAGEVIEVCPVLRFPAAERARIDKTLVFEYYFEWGADGAIALGLGSLYNHSGEPNAEYLKDIEQDLLTIRAIADIPAGQEIVFSYSGPSLPRA